MTQQKMITLEEALDNRFGKKGTPERDKFDSEVAEAIRAYKKKL